MQKVSIRLFGVIFGSLHEFQHYTINEIKSYPLLYNFSFRTTVIRRKRWDSDIRQKQFTINK